MKSIRMVIAINFVIMIGCDMLGIRIDALELNRITIRLSTANMNSISANTSNINYKLEEDISLSGDWTPIGTKSDPFTGTFDGQGYTISGLNIPDTQKLNDNYAGFFGYVGNGAKIRNLTISQPTIDTANYSNAGVLAGFNNGLVENVRVIAGSIKGKVGVGGLIGYNLGIIRNCYSTATVMGGDDRTNGGLVGYNNGNISNCYAAGNIQESNNYANLSPGGLVGENYSDLIKNCYFDRAKTGQSEGVGIGEKKGVIGYLTTNSGAVHNTTSSTAISENDFNGWDFNNIWKWEGLGQWPKLK